VISRSLEEGENMKIKRIAVIGSGLMGHGIAQVAAQAGFEVSLRDVTEDFIESGMNMIKESLEKFVKNGTISDEERKKAFERIHPTLDLEKAVADADLIIEAVPEIVELKKKVLKEVDELAPKHAIITSNTSSLSITDLASATNRPEKFCGMHWFNPPQLMELIEVIRGVMTSDRTIESIVKVSKEMGKEPIVVKKDSPGHIVSRVLVAAYNEALYLVWENIATPEEVDKAIELGLRWPMGPMKLMDYTGVETALHTLEILQRELGDPKYRPCPLLRQMVRAGLLGRKTGKGFYEWKK